jgi:hypothetical protein
MIARLSSKAQTLVPSDSSSSALVLLLSSLALASQALLELQALR